jgi:WD40 repeat protein
MKRITAILSILFAFAAFLRAGEPTREPILTINSEMHVAPIYRIDVDRQERYILTASYDKTSKLWDAKSGQYIRTLRSPIDVQQEGRLYACAISPDGRFGAVAGWTGDDWYGVNNIYVFDLSSGEIVKTLRGHTNVIFHLEFSHDGHYLGASLGGGNGVKIYETSGWKLVASLDGFGKECDEFAWARDGRIAVTCYDGTVSLFSSSFRKLKSVNGTGGDKPYAVAFSPDGSKLAVGYVDNTRVQVLNGYDLSVDCEPSMKDIKDGESFYAVAWSLDGSKLYAGGGPSKLDSATQKWYRIVRQWDDGGKGDYVDFLCGDNTVFSIKPLSDGGIAWGGAGPAFGRNDRDGSIRYDMESTIMPYASYNTAHLRVSADAKTIGFTPYNSSSYVFSVEDRSLLVSNSDLSPAITDSSAMPVSDWKNNYYPKLNGKALDFLVENEMSRCVAIDEPGAMFVLGTSWNLYGVNDSGTKIWKQPAPGTAWAVNIASGKRVAVFAYGDGTIRWHRLSDGQEILAFFADQKSLKWVLWTPSGYYDCSAGGDNLIGWHVNNGDGAAADYYSASRFSSRFYRPDVIQQILETLDEEQALTAANQNKGMTAGVVSVSKMLPPVVRILSPENDGTVNKQDIDITVSLKSPNGSAIDEVKTMINGRPVENNLRGVNIVPKNQNGDMRTISLSLSEGGNVISVMARNESGWSEAATVNVTFEQPKAAAAEFIIKPKLYVLAIGVSDYDNKDYKLNYPAKDAADFAAAMQKQQGSLYREVVAKTVVDKDATKDEILDGMDWIRKETTSKDVAMVFLAGHGINDQNGVYYFLPVNANLDKVMRTCVPFSDIKNTVSSIAGKALFFVDTCHSGNVMGGRRGLVDITAVVNELAATENGVVVFASSTGNQYSLESSSWGNGAFTKALIEGISGKADYQNNGRITVNMLDLYISERVKELTKGQQTPTTTRPVTVPDFPIIVR